MVLKSDITKKNELIINQEYLERFETENDLFKELNKDLVDIFNDGTVYLNRPRDTKYNPVFADVLSYVCAISIQGNYIMGF